MLPLQHSSFLTVFNFIFCLFGVFDLEKLFYFLCFDFQTAVVPHVSLDIHHADFGWLQDPKSVEQKVQLYFLYLVSLKLTNTKCTNTKCCTQTWHVLESDGHNGNWLAARDANGTFI